MTPDRSRTRQRVWRKGRFVALAGIVVALAAVGALPRRSDSGAGILKKADQLFRSGKFDDALRYYRLLAETHPDSAHADNALFQQGLILATHLRRASEARAAYEALLNRHPDSPLADDALMASGALLLEARDYEAALVAYRAVVERFAENRDATADAQLAIARILFRRGDRRALETLQTVLRDFPDKTARCAEAQYLLGQCYQEVRREPDQAVKAYQVVLDDFGDSQFAEPARQAIGLIYYQRKQEEKEVLLDAGTLTPGEEGTDPFIEAVRIALSVRSVNATAEQLLGLTGLAFSHQYPRDETTSTPLTAGNPLDAVCAAFGLRYELIEARDHAEAWARLRQTIDAEQPVLALVRASPPRWSTIIGYRQRPEQILVRGDGMALRRIDVKNLEATLQRCATLGAEPPADWAKFVFVSLGGTPRPGERQRITRRVLVAAANTLRGNVKSDIPHGLKAWAALATDLEELSKETDADRLAAVQAWAKGSIPAQRTRRIAGIRFLRSIMKDLPATDHPRLQEAIDSLKRSEALQARLQSRLAPAASEASDPAEVERWAAALTLLAEITDAERTAADALAALNEATGG